MYGDPDAIRRRAASVREQAVDVRHEADRLVAGADRVAWHSVGAGAMRARIRDRAAGLRSSAGALDDAAQRLDEHAAEVERLLELIAAIEKKMRSIVSGAVGRIEGAAHSVVSGAEHLVAAVSDHDQWLADLPLPLPGHKDWLDLPDHVPDLTFW